MDTEQPHERVLIRDLAKQVAAIAQSEANESIKKRWRDVNALRKPDRAPVWCRPVGAWSEILPDDSLQCHTPWLRQLELTLRRTLIKHDIGDDNPVPDYFCVGTVLDCDPPNIWGVDIEHAQSGADGGAWAYEPPLQRAEDFAKLTVPTFTYNKAETERRLNRMDDLLGDILPVRQKCGIPVSPPICGPAADLRGLTQLMMDCIAEPELLHRLMAHIRDVYLSGIDQLEALGLLTPNNDGPMTCSDWVGPAASGPLSAANLWYMTNSQEFDQISPEMWKEFCLDYELPIIERFGLSSYGCCENLTHKMDDVLRIPNLRIFVCSAWTDLEKTIDHVGEDYVIMWRQKATDVVFAEDETTLRRELEDGTEKLQGSYYQIVLRELQTLDGHPDRLHVWTRHAIEAAEKFA